MANKNLFYSLYSHSQETMNPGYVCSSAVDETGVSFDISGSDGVITDSNGTTLSQIDLSAVHAEGLTQYNTETRIIQPWSCCLLQGQEYGLANATYYFLIPKNLQDTINYEKFCNVELDVVYNNFSPEMFHISVKADGINTIADLINDEFEKNNINVSVSLQVLEGGADKAMKEYLVFMAQEEGYFYYIMNLKLLPIMISEDWPESPFSNVIEDIRNVIYSFIEQYHPVFKDDEYNPETYQVNCELYSWFIRHYREAMEQSEALERAIEIIYTITDDMSEEEISKIIEEANKEILNTIFDSRIFDNYDTENLNIILTIIQSLKALQEQYDDYYPTQMWLIEDRKKRIPLMKYPNGAFRGIVVVPDFPRDSDYEYSSLWVNHVKDTVNLYEETEDGHYKKKKYGVLSNATLMNEDPERKHKHLCSNISLVTALENGWEEITGCQCDYTTYNVTQQPEDTMYMGQSTYSRKSDVVGLFRYIQYVNDEQNWLKIGELYIAIGKDDDPNSTIKNLPTSLLIYNPNSIPVRIKYMIFS